jgi:hypothetical protein
LNDEEFHSLLDELGGDPIRWPEPRRQEAQALLVQSAQACASLKAMQAVESLLAHPAPAFDTSRIAARAAQARQAPHRRIGAAARKVSFAALGALALAAGILVGMTPPSDTAIIGSVQTALNGSTGDVW